MDMGMNLMGKGMEMGMNGAGTAMDMGNSALKMFDTVSLN